MTNLLTLHADVHAVDSSNNKETTCTIQEMLDTANQAYKQATFEAAMCLVDEIDHCLQYGYHHYRGLDGNLLTTLDQVVASIQDGIVL